MAAKLLARKAVRMGVRRVAAAAPMVVLVDVHTPVALGALQVQ